ncbi:DUF4397 domain-containing protein [Kribbella sp. ALI-6-A]|uniref:DUF4397 domain-containing protein n=1 Tax=Kribbella sp. ALI-6-A TaxID=1933817 RepID=UPI001EDC085F|nr:DUF4397 domain-containing protein [Kribbella sp. ALI-6-A]
MFSLVLALLVAAVPAVFAAPAGAAAGGVVYVVQGLPGQTVDVRVDGKVVARGVAATKVVGPFSVAAGQRRITAVAGGKTLVDRQIAVKAGSNQDVVIHRPAAPTAPPVITSYPNKLTAVPKDKAAVRVAHTAAVGPADIRVNGKVLFANVANGESLDVVVPAGTYTVDIVPAGANGPVVLGPAQLPVEAGYLTRVFAVGEPNSKTMAVAVATLRLPGTGTDKPGVVDTGTGGQAAAMTRQEPSVAPLLALVLLGGCAVLVTVRKAVRR